MLLVVSLAPVSAAKKNFQEELNFLKSLDVFDVIQNGKDEVDKPVVTPHTPTVSSDIKMTILEVAFCMRVFAKLVERNTRHLT